MATTTRSARNGNSADGITDQLRVSAYDRTAGLLTALLILVGTCVIGMFGIWLASQVWPTDRRHQPIELVDEASGGGGKRAPELVVFDEPLKEEIQTAEEPPMEVVLQAVTDAVSTQFAVLDAPQPQAPGVGPRPGPGDGPYVGPRGCGPPDVVPRWERWEIRYASDSTEVYARQLDSFGIELGAVGGRSQNLDLASRFSTKTPRRSSKLAADEKRLYMSWREGSLADTDRQLLKQAGIPIDGRIILQLYPREAEDQLALLEHKHAGDHDVGSIKKTLFGVRAVGDSYEFFVRDQLYRNAAN